MDDRLFSTAELADRLGIAESKVTAAMLGDHVQPLVVAGHGYLGLVHRWDLRAARRIAVLAQCDGRRDDLAAAVEECDRHRTGLLIVDRDGLVYAGHRGLLAHYAKDARVAVDLDVITAQLDA